MTVASVRGLEVLRSETSQAARPMTRNVRVKFPRINRIASSSAAPNRLDFLERQRHALPDTDAHGGERAFATALFQPMNRGQRKPRARHAERMPERDRAAVRIDVVGIIGNAELAETREPLRGEGF